MLPVRKPTRDGRSPRQRAIQPPAALRIRPCLNASRLKTAPRGLTDTACARGRLGADVPIEQTPA